MHDMYEELKEWSVCDIDFNEEFRNKNPGKRFYKTIASR
jgi:hypothetical protein